MTVPVNAQYTIHIHFVPLLVVYKINANLILLTEQTLGKLFSDSNAWGNIEAHYSHQNPKRKSYDAVFININNRMVSALKHGTAMEVISSIEAGQSVFCTTTALSKTDSYFLNLKKERWLVYSCLISGIQSELLKESKNVDLKLLIRIVKRNITPSALNLEEMRQNLAESPSETEDSNDIVIVKELNLAQEIIVLEEMCAKYPTLKVFYKLKLLINYFLYEMLPLGNGLWETPLKQLKVTFPFTLPTHSSTLNTCIWEKL